MKWCKLYRRIGKQPLKITQNKDVIAIINGEEVPLILKFKKDGSPYLISKEDIIKLVRKYEDNYMKELNYK